MPRAQQLRVNDRVTIPLGEVRFSYVRSRGPGGQNVNKVNSKAVLRWNANTSQALPADIRSRFLERYVRRINDEGDLVLTSQRFRDQGRNVADCLAKLQQLILDVAVAPTRRIPTRPSRGVKERRLKNKQAKSQRKQMRRPPRMDD